MDAKISIFRTPRTGSTMLKRAVLAVMDLEDDESSHSLFSPKYPLVVTVRDWRDVLASHWRIRFAHIEEKPSRFRISCSMNSLDASLERLQTMIELYPDATIWRYEEFYREPLAMEVFLARILGRRLTYAEFCKVKEVVLPNRALQIQNRLEIRRGETKLPFSIEDKGSGIHLDHIGPAGGFPGAWKASIPEEFHEWINEKYTETLKLWGYEL